MSKENNQIESWSRRNFLQSTGASILGVSLLPLAGCDSILVEPITLGTEIPFLTPVSSFFEKIGAEVSIANWQRPIISKADWSLTIDGLVNSATTIRYSDLESEIASGNYIDLLKTMRCVIDSNDLQGLIGTAIWKGVPLRTFLDRAGVDQVASKRLRLYGADRFTNNMTLDRVYNRSTNPFLEPILVTHMNGQELPQKFGGPVRLIVYETFGYKNVKWLERVEAVSADTDFGTYQDAGFFDEGVMKLSSRITNPINRSEISAGSFQFQGFATTGGGPVAAVELNIDGVIHSAEIIPFSEITQEDSLLSDFAQLNDGEVFPYDNVWVKWRLNWDAAPGNYTIRITALDRNGNEQPQTDTEISDGINAKGEIQITVV